MDQREIISTIKHIPALPNIINPMDRALEQ